MKWPSYRLAFMTLAAVNALAVFAAVGAASGGVRLERASPPAPVAAPSQPAPAQQPQPEAAPREPTPAPAPPPPPHAAPPQPQPVQRAPQTQPPPPGAGARGFWAALPQANRDAIRAELIQTLRAARAQRQEARAARVDLGELASQETYDPEAIERALARVRAADAALLAPIHATLARSLSGLTPQQRRAAIEAAGRASAERWETSPQQGAQPPAERRRERAVQRFQEERERRLRQQEGAEPPAP